MQGQAPYTVTVPLKGLSGVLRRAAYKVPDWKPRRWLMLLVADRLDALEARLTPRNSSSPAASAAAELLGGGGGSANAAHAGGGSLILVHRR